MPAFLTLDDTTYFCSNSKFVTSFSGETEWTAPSPKPLALTHCVPHASSLRDLSSASVMDMSKRLPSEEKNPVNSAHNAGIF